MTKRYSEQFKQEALNFVQTHPSLGVAAIAKQLGVGYSTLDNWLRQHRNILNATITVYADIQLTGGLAQLTLKQSITKVLRGWLSNFMARSSF